MTRRQVPFAVTAARKFPNVILVRRQAGGIHATSWPRKRGKTKTPPGLDRVNAFSQAAKLVKQADPSMQLDAIEFCQTSVALYRDVMTAEIYGTHFDAYLADGRLLTGWPVLGANIQQLLDQISDTPGAMLIRTLIGWQAIAPGTVGQVLTATGTEPAAEFEDLPASGGGGAFNQVWPLLAPSQASTGLSNAVNLSSGSITDRSCGVAIQSADMGGGANIAGAKATAPATPYNLVVAFQAVVQETSGAGSSWAIGWCDASNKLQILEANTSAPVGLNVQNWSSPTSYSGLAAGCGNFLPPGIWFIRLSDDGTTAKIDVGPDGETWFNLFSQTKSSGFLGSSGYANIFVGMQPSHGAVALTVLDWSL